MADRATRDRAAELQRRALAALQQAAKRGQVPPIQPAMLEDRIRAFEGKGQRCGTQFDWDANGEMSPLPVDDPDGLDQRRQALGLKPLAEDIAERRQAAAQGHERLPADWAERERQVEAWLRAVGWRD